MKLSQLAALVSAMQTLATLTGNSDPNVLFYNEDPRHPEDLEVAPRVTPDRLGNLMCIVDGSVAKRGDFALPLTAKT